MIRKHIETIVLSLVTAGIISMASFYVSAQTNAAALNEQVKEQGKRLNAIEEVVKSLALTQERMSATQESMARLLDRLEQQRYPLRPSKERSD